MSAVVHDLRPEMIVVGERLRPVSDAAVADLAASMARVGQIQPITVFRRGGNNPRLVTGHHRLVAARKLGWETVSCSILPPETTEDDCLQIEIAENLHRNDLSREQRDRHIRLLAEIIERQDNLQSQQNASIESKRADGRGHRPEGTIAKVAKQSGLSKDTVRRVLKPAADRAEETSKRRAKQAENDRIRGEARAKLPESIRVVEDIKATARKKGWAETPETRAIAALEAENSELREANAALTADLAAAKAENERWETMRVQFEQGGFEKVVGDLKEQVRVLGAQVALESQDKASWAKSSKAWRKRAVDLGWSNDEIIDLSEGARA